MKLSHLKKVFLYISGIDKLTMLHLNGKIESAVMTRK